MAHVTVIGYGNPLRGDDGLGWLVAKHLAESVTGSMAVNTVCEGVVGRASRSEVASVVDKDGTGDDFEVLALHQLTPELAEVIGQSKFVFFVDASCDGEPGCLSCRVIKPNSSLSKSTTHHLDPPSLLALTQELYGTYPDITILLTISGESFDYKEGLSPTVSKALPILEGILDAYIGTVMV